MADRVKQVAIPAPVAQLVAAWNERSADRFAAALAADALVAVPPLHLELHGRDEVWDGVARLFGSFGALRYTSRHRYQTPDGVTDEVLLEGLQTRDFLGAPPPGHPGAVAARVMMRHNGREITSLTVWPDVGALRGLSDGLARRIDLRTAGAAAPVVAALRATIPATEARVSVGEGRTAETLLPESATLLPAPGDAEPPPDAGTGKKGRAKGGPKAPMPRKARRRRAIAAGVVMLALAAVLGAYVVQGVRSAKETVTVAVKPRPTPAPTAAAAPPTPSPTTTPSTTPSASPSVSFDQQTNTFRFSNTILFETNSAKLRPEARASLHQVVAALIGEKRYGAVTITGYTDDQGPAAYNLELSTRRARVVKAYFDSRLPPDQFHVTAVGKGEAEPAGDNGTAAGRETNRRVLIVVPKPQI